MKARIKFQKYGAMKFIGHLDVMRYFQKLFRRAEIDNEYSKGFSPHQIMSFAAPLGVGLTSDAEYLDVQLLSSDTPKLMLERINAAATEGFRIIDFRPLLDPEENKKVITAMSLVASADYLVSLKDGYELGDIRTQSEFKTSFAEFLSKETIVINKKTKNSEKEVDIRPMITMAAFDDKDYEATFVNPVPMAASVSDRYDNGIRVFLQTDTGSSSNLKPELVMEAFCETLNVPFQEFAWQVHRLEVYTKDVDSGMLISLDKLDR